MSCPLCDCLSGTQFIQRETKVFEYRTAKARWGKRKQAEGYSSVKRNSDLDLGRKETTIRSYRGGNRKDREEK